MLESSNQIAKEDTESQKVDKSQESVEDFESCSLTSGDGERRQRERATDQHKGRFLTRIFTQLPTLLQFQIAFFQKKTNERSYEEQKQLLPFFKFVKAFKDIGIEDQDLQKILVQLQIEFFKEGQVIFRNGDEGDYFYIVLDGKVDLYLPNPEIKKLQHEIANVERLKFKAIKEKYEIESKKDKSGFQNIQLQFSTKLIEQLTHEVHHLKALLSDTPAEIKHMTFKEGDSFGEKAFLKFQPRAGTCISDSDTFCVTVHKDLYIKTVKRYHLEMMQKKSKFLRQISFISNWINKDLNELVNHLKTKQFEKIKTKIHIEDHLCKTVVFVKAGEFQITKSNMNHVFLNHISGITKINLENGQHIVSTDMHLPPNKIVNIGAKINYVGSVLQLKIDDYLNNQIKEETSVADLFTSDTNQPFFKEIIVGTIGVGSVFGASDSFYNRNCVYSLTSLTPNAQLYIIDSENFNRVILGVDPEKMNFEKYAKQEDTRWANKLADALIKYNKMRTEQNKQIGFVRSAPIQCKAEQLKTKHKAGGFKIQSNASKVSFKSILCRQQSNEQKASLEFNTKKENLSFIKIKPNEIATEYINDTAPSAYRGILTTRDSPQKMTIQVEDEKKELHKITKTDDPQIELNFKSLIAPIQNNKSISRNVFGRRVMSNANPHTQSILRSGLPANMQTKTYLDWVQTMSKNTAATPMTQHTLESKNRPQTSQIKCNKASYQQNVQARPCSGQKVILKNQNSQFLTSLRSNSTLRSPKWPFENFTSLKIAATLSKQPTSHKQL